MVKLKFVPILFIFYFKKLQPNADQDAISQMIEALSIELPDQRSTLSARALFSTKYEKNTDLVYQSIYKILFDFHVEQLGSCFMIVVNIDIVPIVLRVVS